MKKRYSFIMGAFVLAVGGVIAKIIGAVYKIPLTHILGTNGMGVYYLIFPLYSMLLIFASSGISIAVSRLVAIERAKKHKKNEMRIFIWGVLISFFVSLFFSFLIIVFSKNISIIQGNINAYIGYIAIAPALICSSVIAVIRSYFQGIENMVPTSASTIFEQLVKFAFGLILSYRFLSLGIEYAVLGAILGVTISELCSMLLLVANFIFYKKRYDYKFLFKKDLVKNPSIILAYKGVLKLKNKYNKICQSEFSKKYKKFSFIDDVNYLTIKQTVVSIFKIALPSMLASVIMPITALIDSFIVINLLVSSGISSVAATSLYGISNGIITSLIGLPVVLISALSTALLPNLSSSTTEKVIDNTQIKIHFFIKFTWVIALIMFVLFLVLSPEIVSFLFSGGFTDRALPEFDFAYKLLMVASVSIIYYAFLHTFIAILQALNKPIVPFYALLISLVLRTVLSCVLISIKEINVFGVVISNVVFLSVASLICINYINKICPLSFSVKKLAIFPLFSGLVAGVFVFFTKFLLYEYLPLWLYLGISGVLGAVLYFVLIYLFKVFNARETEMFPKINKLLAKKVNKKV